MRTLHYIGGGGSSWRDPRNWALSEGGGPLKRLHARGDDELVVSGFVKAAHGKTLDLRGMPHKELRIVGFVGLLILPDGRRINFTPAKKSRLRGAIKKLLPKPPSVSLSSVPRLPMPAMISRAASAVYAPVWRRRQRYRKPLDPLVVPRWLRENIRTQDGWKDAVRLGTCALVVQGAALFVIPFLSGGASTWFWVGGTGTWDGATTTHWATTSGGAGGAGVPVAGDTVNFDANSGTAATVTVAAAAANVAACTINKSDITLTASGALSQSSCAMTLTAGTLNTNGQTVSWLSFSSNNSNTRTLTLGASQVTVSASSATAWDCGSATNMTVNGNTSTVTLSGTSAGMNVGFSASVNYNNVAFTGSGTPQIGFTNGTSSSIQNLTVTGSAAKTNAFLATSASMKVVGTVTLGGSSSVQGVNRLLVRSSTVGTQRTITAAAYVISGDVDFMDINLAYSGAASWTNAGSAFIGDCQGNAGAVTTNATAAVQQTWSGTSGGNWSTNAWTTRVPLPQDSVKISSAFTAAQTVTGDMPRLGGDIDFTGSTGAPTFNNGLATLSFGSWTMVAGMLFGAGANTHTLSGRGTHTIKSASVNINGGGRSVTIDAVVGTYTHTDAAVWGATFIINSGTWSSGNFAMTFNAFFCSSVQTRTVNAGTSTITATAGGVTTPFQFGNTGTLTLNASSSTFVVSSPDNSTKTFTGAGISCGTLRFVSTGTAALTITGSNTFVNLDLECTSARTITLDSSGTNTVTGTLTLQGGSLTNLLSVVSSTAGTQTTIALGTTGVLGIGVCLSVKDVAVTGTNSPVVVGGSTNVSNNSGITFAKSAVAAGGNWSATATWSDGVVPTAASPVFLVNGSGSVTVDVAAVCASFDCVTYTGTLTFSASNTLTSSPAAGGAVRFASGMTLTTSSTNVMSVSLPSGGTVTLTSAGRTLSQFTIGGSTTGTLLVADAMTAANTVTLNSGGLNTNGQACTWGAFSSNSSTTRTLTLGASAITITGSAAWTTSTTTNLTVTANTAVVTLNGASAAFSSGTFNWNGMSLAFTGSGTATLGSGTWANITRTGTAAKTDALTVNANFTVTGTFTATGNSAVNRLLVSSSTVGTQRTVTATSWSLKNSDFMDIAGAGASSSISPTLSGNEITDLSRIAAAGWGTGQQGGSTDGLSNGSGTGIWEAATNLFRRGQCDATTDWSSNSAAASIDATTPAPFSPQSIKSVTNGTVGSEGTAANSATGQAIAAGTSVVGSVYFKGVAGQTYEATMAVNNTDASTTIGAVLNFTATGAWQLVIPPALTVAVGKTGDSFRVRVLTHTIRAETLWYAHGMLQSGVSAVTPYVATSGGATASRAAAKVQAPSTLINTTQGWAAVRVAMGFPSGVTPVSGGFPSLFRWQIDANNRLIGYYDTAQAKFVLFRTAGGVGATVSSAVQSFSTGAVFTIIFAWDAGNLYVSVNGGAFTSAANAFSPAGTPPALMEIGSGDSPCDSDVLWFACGTGTLTNTDAGTINGFGNFCPTVAALPGTATGVWNGATWVGTSMGDCQGNAGITFDASVQQTWSGTSGGNWSTNAWTTRVPLPQDDVVISSAFSASQTITADMPRLGRSHTWTGSTGAPTFSPSVPVSLFGNLTFATGVLVAANANSVTFAGRGAQTITSNGVNLQGGGRSANFEAIIGSYTLQDDAFWGCGVSHLSGTLDAGNHNVRCNNVLSTSSRTRTLNMGSGTWTVVQTGTFASWSILNTSTLTLNASTSTIAFTASDSGVTKTFQGGGLTYGTLQFKSTGNAALVITGNNTFSALDLECTTARTITFDAGGTNTVRAILTLQGASGQLLSLVSSSPGTATTIVATTTLPTQGNIAFDSLSADVTLTLPVHRGAQFGVAAAGGTQFTMSAYVRGLAGGTARISLWDNVLGKQSGADVALTSTGQRISVTAVTGTGATSFFVLVESSVSGLAFNVDGVQDQLGPVATPFGLPGGARVQAPLVASGSTLLNATQGWVAARVKMGFAFNSVPHAAGLFPVVFCWADSAGNDIRLRYNQDSAGGFTQYAWSAVRESGGASAVVNAAQSAAQSFALGDTVTVIAAWTATGLFISVNGGAFVAAPSGNTSIPTLAATLLDIGTGGTVFTGREIGSTLLWFACGTGILSNGDAAALAAMTDIPNLAAIPAEAVAKGLWKCRTANMKVPGTGAGDALVAPVVYDTAGNLVGGGDTVTVPRGSPAQWYDLPFSADPGGLVVAADAEYDVGLIAGGVGSHVARFFSSKPGYSSTGGGRVWSDTFSDGPSNPFGTEWPTENDMTVYGDVFDSYAPPPNELEFYYGRLPFREAQKVFASTQPVHGTTVTAEASWHGTALDPERGSFVVVQAGGIFDQDDSSSLIGQRVKITSLVSVGAPRSVYAFVHNALAIDAVSGVTPDLSLPRRLWMQLALPGDDTLTVTVQRMA